MKIITYNINGIRSSASKGLSDWIIEQDADILCFQEVRATEEVTRSILNINQQISLFNTDLYLNKYNVILNCGTIAGYSGTLILTKTEPNKVEFGLNNEPDPEGRTITAYYNNFAVVNCYVPNGSNRLEFKMNFYKNLTKHLVNLSKTTNVILCTDANVAHAPQDLSHPKECANRSGYLIIERQAFTDLLNYGFCDIARAFNGNKLLYTWRSYRSLYTTTNTNNYVYRFDYILCNNAIKSTFNSVSIQEQPYSDHLPIIATFTL